ncbi:cytochrome P450, partial [Melanogaster broomeanus]
RSSNYSDRPNLVTTALFGMDFNTAFLRYGDAWRLHRRFFHQSLKVDSASRFVPMQQSKAHQLLRGLLESPELYIDHLLQYSSSVIMKSIYDYDPLTTNDHMVYIIGRPPANSAPVLTIPSWFPGMGIKRNGALCREWAKDWNGERINLRMGTVLITMEERRKCHSSMIFDALRKTEQKDAAPGWLQCLKGAAATAFAGSYSAGSETSSSALTTFLLAMILNPEVQEKAYAQINAVVGEDRLPTLDDRSSLTYIDAIMRETLRWNPVTPLSIPHAAVNDDIYDGYHIPKGATVMTNTWFDHAVLAMFRQALIFKLSVPKDEDGKDVSFEPEWAAGITTIVPRIPGMDANKLEELINANA